MLLCSVTLLYILIFAGIYLWSSGFNPSSLLFWRSSASAVSKGSRSEGAAADRGDVDHSSGAAVLPPLDDGPRDEPLFTLDSALLLPVTPNPHARANETVQTEMKSMPVAGVSFTSRMSPIKCWDDRGFEYNAADCDSMAELSRLADFTLGIFDRCRTESTSVSSTGLLAVFAEVDFIRNAVSIWPGTASTLRAADKVAECVTEGWRALPFTDVSHRFSRYRLKGLVRFEGARLAAALPAALAVTKAQTAELEKAAADAKEVTVTRDRVRVRKAPVDGEIIGFISTGQRVKLIEVTDEWCLIKTKRGNVGWMICWGLDIPSQAAPPPPPKSKSG